MSTSQVIVFVAAIVLIDGILVFAIRAWMKGLFEELARAYPPRPIRAGARRKRYQSIGVNSTNFGGCIELATDDEHVHVRPMGLARLFGARDLSLPRAPFAEAPRAFGGARKAKLGKWTIAVSGATLD